MNKAKAIERLMRLSWSSLESHLKYTYINTTEGKNFHRKCVREYTEMLELLSKLL